MTPTATKNKAYLIYDSRAQSLTDIEDKNFVDSMLFDLTVHLYCETLEEARDNINEYGENCVIAEHEITEGNILNFIGFVE